MPCVLTLARTFGDKYEFSFSIITHAKPQKKKKTYTWKRTHNETFRLLRSSVVYATFICEIESTDVKKILFFPSNLFRLVVNL